MTTSDQSSDATRPPRCAGRPRRRAASRRPSRRRAQEGAAGSDVCPATRVPGHRVLLDARGREALPGAVQGAEDPGQSVVLGHATRASTWSVRAPTTSTRTSSSTRTPSACSRCAAARSMVDNEVDRGCARRRATWIGKPRSRPGRSRPAVLADPGTTDQPTSGARRRGCPRLAGVRDLWRHDRDHRTITSRGMRPFGSQPCSARGLALAAGRLRRQDRASGRRPRTTPRSPGRADPAGRACRRSLDRRTERPRTRAAAAARRPPAPSVRPRR